MPKLPDRAWLPLSDAADFIVERCECSIDDAREALFGALRDGQVYARGTRPNPVYERAKASGFQGGCGGGPDWRKAFPPQVGRNLDSRFFLSHDPNWQTNTVGEVTNVEVYRVPLLQWLSGDDAARMGLSSAYPEPETGQHPQETAPTPQENDERPEYTPPYIAFMLRAAREMGLESGTRKPKETIEGWLRENWPDQFGEQTKRKIERMAHLLRHPKDERGGYFKPTRDE